MIHDYLDWKRRDTKANHWTKNVIRKSKIEKKPENENTISFIKNMKDKVNISLAHTNADYESAKAANEASWTNRQLTSAILLKRFVGC